MSANKSPLKSTSHKVQTNCDYHDRSPKFYEQRCAYHANQIITNFCKCQECLLPVCPSCVKLHTDQHKYNKTTAKYQELVRVLDDIEGEYGQLNRLIEGIKSFLIEIEGDKKANQAKIRAKLIEYRTKLLKQFQTSIINMQNRLIHQIVEDDNKFIKELQTIDNNLTELKTKLTQDNTHLFDNEQMLKHIIMHYSNKNGEHYTSQIKKLRYRSEQLIKKNIVVTVDENQLVNLSKAINRFIQIEINDSDSYVKKV